MRVELQSDFPVTDEACQRETGRTLSQWFRKLTEHPQAPLSRRDAINWLYAEMNKHVWWPTTVWVEFERSRGVVNKKDGMAEGYNICATKTITAPVATVYRCWTGSDLLNRWLGPQAAADVQTGGVLNDGDGHQATFLRIRENKDLRFQWLSSENVSPTLVDVAFADKGKGKTGVTLNHQRIQQRDEADGLRQAWGESLEQLKQLAESLA